MAKKKKKRNGGKKSERIILRAGEALVEAEPAWSAAEPEVVIGELDGPVGQAIANLIGNQSAGHSKTTITRSTTQCVLLDRTGKNAGKNPGVLERMTLAHA